MELFPLALLFKHIPDGTAVGPVLPEVTTLQWHYYPTDNPTDSKNTATQAEVEEEAVAAVVVASGFDLHVLWLKKTTASKHNKQQVRVRKCFPLVVL